MSGKTIATIYFYIISAGSIVLMVIGIFNSVNFLVNSTQFDKYPLRYGGISNCDYAGDGRFYGGPVPVIKAVPIESGESIATPTAEEVKQLRENCLKNEEADRIQHRVGDIKNAITFSLVGLVLFGIHFPQARKQSKNG